MYINGIYVSEEDYYDHIYEQEEKTMKRISTATRQKLPE